MDSTLSRVLYRRQVFFSAFILGVNEADAANIGRHVYYNIKKTAIKSLNIFFRAEQKPVLPQSKQTAYTI